MVLLIGVRLGSFYLDRSFIQNVFSQFSIRRGGSTISMLNFQVFNIFNLKIEHLFQPDLHKTQNTCKRIHAEKMINRHYGVPGREIMTSLFMISCGISKIVN
jgi:hypothetical protein